MVLNVDLLDGSDKVLVVLGIGEIFLKIFRDFNLVLLELLIRELLCRSRTTTVLEADHIANRSVLDSFDNSKFALKQYKLK